MFSSCSFLTNISANNVCGERNTDATVIGFLYLCFFGRVGMRKGGWRKAGWGCSICIHASAQISTLQRV